MPPKPICKFYQKGYCRNGDRCKFLHGESAEAAPANGNRITTPQQFMNKPPHTLAKEIRDDLDEYRAIQMDPKLTAYSSSEFAPTNLIAGRDVSPEELHLQYLEAVQNNKLDEYNRNIDLRKRDMDYCINEIRSKDSLAARYQQLGITHRDSMKPFIGQTVEESMAKLQNTAPSNGAFGSTNAGNPFGSSSNPFGSSGFGNSGFGNANTNASNGAFGNANTNASNGAFGSTNNTSTGGAFGSSGFSSAPTTSNQQTSAFGNSGFGGSGFGSSGFGSGTTGGAFGGQKPASGFGSSGFGLSNGSSAFGSSSGAFGLQQTNATSNPSPFGSSATSNNAQAPSAFGSSGFGSSGFGASDQSKPSGFGSSGFGSSGFGLSGFGGSSNTSTQSAFGQSTNSPFAKAPATGFGANGASAFGAQTSQAAPAQAPAQSAFGGSSASPFGSSTLSNPFGQLSSTATQNTASPFGQTKPSGFGSSGFGSNNGSTPSAFGSAPTSGFGTSNSTANANSTSQNPPPQTEGVGADTNSGMGKLAAEVVQAFSAAKFELGKVPDVPPPPQVC